MDLASFDNKYVIALVSSVGGILLTVLTQRILNKRGLFTYFVRHSLVGVSADDAVFGSVRVTWNDRPALNLYSSTVELINQSMKDYENVVVRVFTSDTSVLTERTDIVGTTHIAQWTNEFTKQVHVPVGETASQAKIDLVSSRRDYLLPTMNRGQVVRFYFLNAAKTQNQPTIWLDVVHKGVKIKFRVPQSEVFGVSQPTASLMGAVLGFILLGAIIASIHTVWKAALLALIFGYCAQLPGAIAVKLWRRLRDWFGG